MGVLNKQTDYIGIDIGTTGIRLVQCRKHADKPVLVTYGDIAAPMGVTGSDAAADHKRISELIAQLVKQTGATSKHAVAGLPTNKVFATVITTPKLSNEELSKAIMFQAEQHIPMALNEVKLDWAVLGQGKTDKELEVLLVAAPKTLTEKYLSIFGAAGLELAALEINAVALARSVAQKADNAVVLVDVGSTVTDITIMLDGTPRLIRSVAVGTLTFIKSVAQGLGLDEAQAEQFTHKFGLMQSKLEGQVFKAMKPSLDALNGELEKSVTFFANQYGGRKIEKLILSGSVSAIPEFPVFLSNSTQLPVEISNAWVNVAYPAKLQDDLQSKATLYGVASGLAQRMVG